MEWNKYNFKNQSNLCVAIENWYGSNHANSQLSMVTGNWDSGTAVPSQRLNISQYRLHVISPVLTALPNKYENEVELTLFDSLVITENGILKREAYVQIRE